LRTTLLLMTVLAVTFGWQSNRIRAQRRAVNAIQELGGIVQYSDGESTNLDWRWRWIGKEGIAEVTEIDLLRDNMSDAALVHIRQLPTVKRLFLSGDISDAGLKTLADLPALEELLLVGTKVTLAGVEGLKRARPNLTVYDFDHFETAM
jgi:hypothetical protein